MSGIGFCQHGDCDKEPDSTGYCEDHSVRSAIRDARSANDFALIRAVAHAWNSTQPGLHLRTLLTEIDGGAPVPEKLLLEICLHGYHRTKAGDGLGDDIWALVEEIGRRRRVNG